MLLTLLLLVQNPELLLRALVPFLFRGRSGGFLLLPLFFDLLALALELLLLALMLLF